MGNSTKILFCCGSRPELIKIVPLYRKLQACDSLSPLLCLTGQHKDLLPPHLNYFGIEPDFQLDVMCNGGQGLQYLMEELFRQLPEIFEQSAPGLVIVQGDTASALASAIIAHNMALPLAHMEAGLRTYDKSAPFPEEIFRQGISAITDWHFCPTAQARQNLRNEDIPDHRIFVTGNTSVDMVLETRQKISETNMTFPALRKDDTRPYFLITLHRRESQGSPLIRILNSLRDISRQQRADFDFIIPLHPNPASSHMIRDYLGGQKSVLQNIFLIAPVSYPHFVKLMADAFAILTDSGGIQEEAPSLNTPLLVLRDNTERAEGLKSGCLRLAGTRADTIFKEVNLLINDPAHYKRIQQAPNPFGDGKAAHRIAAHLRNIIEENLKNDTN